MEEVECRLSELSLVVDLRLRVGRGIERQGVQHAEGLCSNEPATNDGKGAEVIRAEGLTKCKRTGNVVRRRPLSRAGDVTVDQVVDQPTFSLAAAGRAVRTFRCAAFQTLLLRVIGA